MSNLFQSGSPVGSLLQLPNLYAPVVTLPNGQVWLRTGSVTPKANASAEAQAIDSLQCHQPVAATTAPAFTPTAMANDGANTWVAVNSTATLSRSTDNGVTWASLSLPGNAKAEDIVWTGTRFVTCFLYYAGSAIYWSATGAAGTWTAATGVPASTGSGSYIAASAGVIFAIGKSNGGGQNAACKSTDNGSTFTSVTIPAATYAGRPAAAGGLWVLNGNNTTYVAPFNLSAAFTAQSTGSTGWTIGLIYTVAAGVLSASTINAQLSTDALKYSTLLPLSTVAGKVASNGSTAVLVGTYNGGVVTTDGSTFREQQILSTTFTPLAFSAAGRVIGTDGSRIDINSPALIGLPATFSFTSGGYTPPFYVRIK